MSEGKINLSRLRDPFPASDIEWRIGRCGMTKAGKPWAKVLAYITARACMDRLDDVAGPENWQDSYEVLEGITSGVLCRVAIKTNKRAEGDDSYYGSWLGKTDGSEFTDTEPFKGGLSGAFKRACVKWGIGRYLYSLEEEFAEVSVEKPKDLKGWHFHQDKKSEVSFWWKEPTLQDWALPNDEQVVKEPLTMTNSEGGSEGVADSTEPHTSQSSGPTPATDFPFADEPFVEGTKHHGRLFKELPTAERRAYLDRLLAGIYNLEKSGKVVDDSIKIMSIKLGRSVDRNIQWAGLKI